MLYSETTGMTYCSVCMLLPDRETHFTSEFDNRKHINRLHEHKNSDSHTNTSLSAAFFKIENARVDDSLLVQIDKEKVYCRALFKRVVVIVEFLCERGLPLHVGNEVFRSFQNKNFLGLLQLLAQFDNFLANHIRRFDNSGKGVPSYFSSTTCNKFVQFNAKEVTTKIANKVNKTKYYSVNVDSTPNVIHIDQVTFIIRYVQDYGTCSSTYFIFYIKIWNQTHIHTVLVIRSYL